MSIYIDYTKIVCAGSNYKIMSLRNPKARGGDKNVSQHLRQKLSIVH